jgi:SAM-dependent methyltransferase
VKDELARTIAVYDETGRCNSTGSPRTRAHALAAQLPPATVIVDAACGPGEDADVFARAGHHVFAFDLSRTMVEHASQKDITPVQADLRAFPFRSGAADVVWLNAALVHLPLDAAAGALKEAARVLRSGGVVHGSVKRRSGDLPGSRWLEDMVGRRWFTYWYDGELRDALDAARFTLTTCVTGHSNTTKDESWLMFAASKTR